MTATVLILGGLGILATGKIPAANAQNSDSEMRSSQTKLAPMMSEADKYRAMWVYRNLDAREVKRYHAQGFTDVTIKGAANIALHTGLPLPYVLRRVHDGGEPLPTLAVRYGVKDKDLNAPLPGYGAESADSPVAMAATPPRAMMQPDRGIFGVDGIRQQLGGAITATTPPPDFGVTPAMRQRGMQDSLDRADPQMRAVLQQLASMQTAPLDTLTPAQARQQPSAADAVKALLQKQNKSTAPQPVGNVADRTVPGPAGDVPVRVYTPQGTGPFSVLVYFHGGGFVIASIDTYDASARALCNAANCVVVSVGYRLAPENKLPAAHEDCYAVTQYVMNNAAEFNANASQVAVGGESAGGNLAADMCLMARDRSGKMPVHQLLVYPLAGFDFGTPSYRVNSGAVPLSRPLVQWFFYYALPDANFGTNPLVDLAGSASVTSTLPSATVITDQIDPLMSEGKIYADKLQKAGVSVRYQNYEGVSHEFFGMAAVVDKAKAANKFAADGLKDGFKNAMKPMR